MNFCDSHRLPRARVDVIDDATVRSLITSVLACPCEPEIVIVLLDDERRGFSIVDVVGADHPDAIRDVAELVVYAATPSGPASVVLASIRPGEEVDLDDVERWIDIDDRLASAGVELLEWYVFGRDITLPREILGEPSRWER